MEEPETTLGQRIRAQRLARRIWQRDLAAAASLSPGYLSELERGKARAAEPALRRLAAALGLEADVLLAQAAREGRLAPRVNSRGNPADEPAGAAPARMPDLPARSAPTTAWLTPAEAAAVIGMTPEAVRRLARAGRLRPARRVRETGVKGPKRWRIAAEAVLAYGPSRGPRPPSGPRPAPAGLLTLADFAARSGLSFGALHRRLEAGVIASVRLGRRRFVPAGELERLLGGER